MLKNKLKKFTNLIKEHKSTNHPVFPEIEKAALNGTLTSEMYHLFSVNIATRTMLSLSEIHACCIQASLELNPVRTAYSVLTGAEEGGFGKPAEVHSVLMMNALNHHGKVVFGLNPLNLKYLMALIRLFFTAEKYCSFIKLKTKYSDIESDLEKFGFYDEYELIDTCKRMAIIGDISTEGLSWKKLEEIEKLKNTAIDKLIKANVLKETIDYCISQLIVLSNMRAGYLQGVGFAHEGLADGMIDKIFRILYAQIDKYSSVNEFMEIVYPYFKAHGNYIDVYYGLTEFTEGVEVTHAQRELEKLDTLDENALEIAWKGANDFADRNAKIWDGLYKRITYTER